MIAIKYTSPWKASWSVGTDGERRFVKKLFSYTDTSDILHRSRMGYFPELCTIDMNGMTMTHGQCVQVRQEAQAAGMVVQVDDAFPRVVFDPGEIPEDFLPGVTLRDYQRLGVRAIAGTGLGIVEMATNAGKTTTFGALVKLLLQQPDFGGIMIMIFSKDLINQTAKRFEQYGVPGEDIGIIHSDIPYHQQIENSRKKVVITTHLSIEKFPLTIDRTRYVICDEAHECTGPLWSAMLRAMPNMTNLIAFTATPWDNEGEKQEMLSIFGQTIFQIPIKFLIDRGLAMNPEIYFVKLVYKDRDKKMLNNMTWQAAQKQFIFNDEARNLLPIAALKKFGGRMLVLYDNLNHGQELEALYRQHGFDTRLAEGKTSTKNRDCAISWFEKDLEPGEKGKVLLGSKVFNQGIDLSGGCDILFIMGAAKKRRTNIQRIGRALRLNRSGRLIVLSVWDGNHKTLAQWSGERKRTFVDLGLPVNVISLEEFADLK